MASICRNPPHGRTGVNACTSLRISRQGATYSLTLDAVSQHSNMCAELRAWLSTHMGDPIAENLVPGTSEDERRMLAALGGIARSLAGHSNAHWPDAIREWLEDGPNPPVAIVEGLRSLGNAQADLLGSTYERVICAPNRRRLGAFFTPPTVVQFLLERGQQLVGSPAVVIEPGAGVGAIALSASLRWPRADILAVDVNVVTLGILCALTPEKARERVRPVLEDYLSWIARGSAKRVGKPRLFLGNPPYTRRQELLGPIEASNLVKSGMASLSAHFLATSLEAMGPEDAICFVLPGSWLEARYGSELRRALIDAEDRQVIVDAFPADSKVFSGADVTTVVLSIGPIKRGLQPFCVNRTVIQNNSVVITESRELDRAGTKPDDLARRVWPTRRRLVTDGGARLVSLSSYARVRKGVASGGNAFFFLTDTHAQQLPAQSIHPAVLRIADIAADTLSEDAHEKLRTSDRPAWILWLQDHEVTAEPTIQTLIRLGEDNGVHRGYLCGHRDPWYRVENIRPPHILIGSMGRATIRAVLNEIGAIPSNSMYGIYVDDSKVARGLTAWLNSPEVKTS